jgi:hypothetical protein
MKIKYLLLLITLVSVNGYAQGWEKLFSKESTDVFRCVQSVTPGLGGYVLAGYTADSTVNDTDAYVVRLNGSGDTIWTFTYNGALSHEDLFYKVINTSDNGFIACGYTASVTGLSDDILYIKLNSSGQLQWAKTFGGSGKERGQDIVETSDGFTIAGYTTSPNTYYDALLLHVDLNGDVLWSETYGGTDYDDANTLKQLQDGGYILGGQSTVTGGDENQFLIRTDVSGNTIWTKNLLTSGPSNIESLVIVSDGFVMAGGINPAGLSDDGYLVKTDTFGVVEWTKTFGGSDQDDFHRVEKTPDGGYILSGTTSSSGPLNPNMWLFKVNSTGDSTWARTFGGDNHDHGYSAIQANGGYVIAGHSGSFGFNNEDGYVVKVGSDGTGTNHLTYITAYSLASPTCSNNSSQVKVVLRNFGNEPASNISVTVEITGTINTTLNTVYPGPLAAHDLVTLTLTPNINTTSGGPMTFFGYADVNNDVYPARNSFSKTVTLAPCVGIEDIETQLGYSLYPNPAHDNIRLEFSQQYLKAKIELMNCTGAIVETIVLNNTGGMTQQIDLSTFAKGLYLFKVTTEDGFDVRRVGIE